MIRFCVFSVVTTLALAGCGSGTSDLGPSSSNPDLADPDLVETLTPLDASTPNAVSDLTAIGLRTTDNEITSGSAVLKHQTGQITLTLNGDLLFDDEQRQNSGAWNDSTITLTPSTVAALTGYDFVNIYNLTGTTNNDGPVVLGVTALSRDLPTTGTARYQGVAYIDGAYLGQNTPFETTGVSTLTANFGGSSNVDVKIDGLSNSSTPFTEIRITGMTLDRRASSFSGGMLSVHDANGETTDAVMGTKYNNDAEGAFFGDEVGGIFVGNGTNATISGAFLAR